MAVTYLSFTSTAYLAQQPELLFGFAFDRAESAGAEHRERHSAILGKKLIALNLDSLPLANKRNDNDTPEQRNGNNAANWLNGIFAAMNLVADDSVVIDGRPSLHSNNRCWSHGGRGSP